MLVTEPLGLSLKAATHTFTLHTSSTDCRAFKALFFNNEGILGVVFCDYSMQMSLYYCLGHGASDLE